MAKKGSEKKQGTRASALVGNTIKRELIVIVRAEAGWLPKDSDVAPPGGAISSLLDLLKAEGFTLQPLFGLSKESKPTSSLAAATMIKPVADLSFFYTVAAPDECLDQLAESLHQLDVVEAAYVKPPTTLAVAMQESVEDLNNMAPSTKDAPPASPDFTVRQGYLNTAPDGIDARYAWTLPGGSGAGIGIIDIEGGWNFAHEVLRQNQGGVIAGTPMTDPKWQNHGTAVVGVIGSARLNFGVTGICAEAKVRAVSIFGGTGSAGAIYLAANASKAGDIILIELHRLGPQATGIGQQGCIAIEWWPDDYAAIRYAIKRGVIVVEAAGNGAVNFDDPIYDKPLVGFPTWWKNPFNPANPSSGAVMVGAGAPPPGTHGRNYGLDRSRLLFSNYGARVDCQSWGREVTTTGYGDLQGGRHENLWYTDRFSGTSSASAIVVGALGCLQGILRTQASPLLTSDRARSLLRATGSPQQDAPGRPRTQRIGNRPDLRQLIAAATKVWKYNQTVSMTYTSSDSQNAWAYIKDFGWRKINPNTPDGVTNVFNLLCQAVANNRQVHIYLDRSFISRVILV